MTWLLSPSLFIFLHQQTLKKATARLLSCSAVWLKTQPLLLFSSTWDVTGPILNCSSRATGMEPVAGRGADGHFDFLSFLLRKTSSAERSTASDSWKMNHLLKGLTCDPGGWEANTKVSLVTMTPNRVMYQHITSVRSAELGSVTLPKPKQTIELTQCFHCSASRNLSFVSLFCH